MIKYRKNASELHRAIGNILLSKEGPFSLYKIHQEYPVHKINPNFKSKRHKFDWVILDLSVVIEGHGQQHSPHRATGVALAPSTGH